jgi:hypothetical protein
VSSCPDTVHKGSSFPAHNGLAWKRQLKCKWRAAWECRNPSISWSKRHSFSTSVQIEMLFFCPSRPGRQFWIIPPQLVGFPFSSHRSQIGFKVQSTNFVQGPPQRSR